MNRTALRETVFKVLFRYEFHDSESFASQMNLFLRNILNQETKKRTGLLSTVSQQKKLPVK